MAIDRTSSPERHRDSSTAAWSQFTRPHFHRNRTEPRGAMCVPCCSVALSAPRSAVAPYLLLPLMSAVAAIARRASPCARSRSRRGEGFRESFSGCLDVRSLRRPGPYLYRRLVGTVVLVVFSPVRRHPRCGRCYWQPHSPFDLASTNRGVDAVRVAADAFRELGHTDHLRCARLRGE